MNGHQQACFSPYMLISSTLQSVFGYDRRKEQDKQADIAQQHQLELRKAKEEFQDELEAQKVADMRAKMAVARKYRAEERFEQTVLQHKTEELRTYFMKCLPIKQKVISQLLDAAKSYKALGYNSDCPLNVVLLHTKQAALDYNDICNELDKTQMQLGNLVYRRWCDKDVAHNSAILNLHAIMSNHRMDGITTYPFNIFGCGWEKVTPTIEQLPFKGDTVIGNDVWIGQNVTIMPGVIIGDGAIIAANSTVVKSVEPYSIYSGNPAKFIKKRFSDEKIEFLLKLEWWNWSGEEIFDNLEILTSEAGLEELMNKYSKRDAIN